MISYALFVTHSHCCRTAWVNLVNTTLQGLVEGMILSHVEAGWAIAVALSQIMGFLQKIFTMISQGFVIKGKD